MMLGLDYSAGRPRGSEVARLGYGFVVRYCGQPGNRKNATKAEVDDMLAHGVAVALVFEATAARASQGFNAGVADARAATAHQAVLGIPASRPIYYAVDFDADPNGVIEYFRGVNSVPGPDSAYGSFRVVQRLRGDGMTVDSWQTVAWSRGQVDAGHDVFQRLGYVTVDGIQCDVNESRTADFGQYPTPMEEEFMAGLTEDDAKTMAGRVEALYAADDVTDWGPHTGEPGGLVKLVKTIAADVAELKARSAADVDEAALAAELAARGVGGVSAAELIAILSNVRLAPAKPEEGTP